MKHDESSLHHVHTQALDRHTDNVTKWACFFGRLLLNIPLEKIYLILRRHHWWWWDAKFIPMLGFRARRDFYRATSTVLHGLGFCGVIRRTAPDNHLNDEQEVRGPILTRIPLGLKLYNAIKHKYWKLRHEYYR